MNTNTNTNNQNEKESLAVIEYCPLCKKNIPQASFKVHSGGMEHIINAFYGKNVLKKDLESPLICNFPNCNKSFTDIDNFVDHMLAKHSKNGFCLFPKCCNKKIHLCKKHFINNHTWALDKFFICPGCKVHEEKCFQHLLTFHMPDCAQCTELLKKINNNE